MNPGVDLNIDQCIWKEFKKLCIDKNISASRLVQEFMEKELEKKSSSSTSF